MQLGQTDSFEHVYMAKFRALASAYAVFVEYPRDVAGRDLGLHFTQVREGGGRIVTSALAWFQLKGVMASTLSADDFKKSASVSISLERKHLAFWHSQVTPQYLVVYVESADVFLVVDIKNWVRENIGDSIMSSDQKTFAVKIPASEVLDHQAFRLMMRENMLPSLRNALQSDDAEARRFFRDAEIVKWIQSASKSGKNTRLRLISWISKMRSEVYFEERYGEEEWISVRSHWQFAMGGLLEAFPYLKVTPARYGEEDENFEYYEDEVESEAILHLSDGQTSYGEMAGYEYVEHTFRLELNFLGKKWAGTISALENAELISVSAPEGQWVSVAPWHARQV